MVRFQATLKQMEKSPTRSAAALAAETGYFDQSHLTLDLARFAAATPRHLASSARGRFFQDPLRRPFLGFDSRRSDRRGDRAWIQEHLRLHRSRGVEMARTTLGVVAGLAVWVIIAIDRGPDHARRVA